MPSSVARLARAAALLPLAMVPLGVLPVALAAPALADGGAAKLVQSAWFWNRPTDAYPLGSPPASPATDPTVPDGGLPVADGPGDGSSAKESYLSFDLGAVPDGATITKFTVTTQEVSPNSAHAEAPKVIACLPPRTWSAGPAQTWAAKPYIDCSTGKVAGKYDSGSGTWTFDVTEFALAWQHGNTGLALLNDRSYTTPYQIVFDSAKTTAAVTYEVPTSTAPGAAATTGSTTTPPAAASRPQPQPQAAPALPASSAGSLPSGFSAPAAPAALPGAVPAAPAAAPAALPAAGPAQAAPVTAAAPVAVAEGVPLRHFGSGPGAAFYGMALLVVGLLVGASWALGGPTPTTTAPASDSRLDRALQARRTPARGVRGVALGSA